MSLSEETRNQENRLDASSSRSFDKRQEDHFSRLLREKWECEQEGHSVCVPTEDGQHFQLSEKNIAAWVKSLCSGEASTSQPPESLLLAVNNGAVWNHTNGTSVLRAVSISPSRRRGSLRSGSTRSASSNASSGVPGIGWLSGRAIKWVGQIGISTIEDAIITKRANQHKSMIKRWEKDKVRIGAEQQEKLFEILGDALEMSMPCYPPRINKIAYEIGRQVQRWLNAYTDIPQTKENASLFGQIQICLLPLLLTRISRFDPLAGDLAWELLDELTRVPLALQGPDTTSTVIRIIARELAYSRCSFQHSWLGVDLLRIVETTLRLRALTSEELGAMHDMAVRRQEQRGGDSQEFCRPWEVALFAQCASQDERLKAVVLGPHGLASLLSALDRTIPKHGEQEDVNWEHVALTLRALAFLSEQKWVADSIDPNVVDSLLNVFRPRIPKRWLCIRFWAMDTIRNIVSHRPSLVRNLIQGDAAVAFQTLTAVPPLTKGTTQILEDYKKEATTRAKELLEYMRKYNEWSPDALPRLETVSITGSFVVEQEQE